MIEYNELDPGIRWVVIWLNKIGFETTDSGDGRTKPPGPDVLPYAHVAIKSSPTSLLSDADHLRRRIDDARPGGSVMPSIQATYDPADQSAVILVSWPPGVFPSGRVL